MRTGIVITSQNHHYRYASRLAPELMQEGADVDLISLCEIRRNTTPPGAKSIFSRVIRILPFHLFGKNKELGGAVLGNGFSIKREIIRGILALYLAPVFFIILRKYDRLVVFNDTASPYRMIIRIAKLFNTQVYMIQEGIRFITPIEQKQIHRLYGTFNKVDHLLVWGPYFKKYFTEIRGKADNIHVVGTLHAPASVAPASKARGERTLVITTNPIDDIGYCTPKEKYDLTKKLVDRLLQYDEHMRVMIKTHPREDAAAYATLLADHKQVEVLNKDIPIQEAVMKASHCLCFASTAGLEALEKGCVLGMVKIYDWDYVFNYVEDGGAYPIDVEARDLNQMLDAFFAAYYSEREEEYLQHLYLRTDHVLDNYKKVILNT